MTAADRSTKPASPDIRPLVPLSTRTAHSTNLPTNTCNMSEAEPESEPRLIRVVGGDADGIIAPAKSKWGEIYVDPSGHGLADRYEVR